MLTTQRHDQRTRRQARFQIERLDDRLVLSAAAAPAAGAHISAVMDRLEGRLAAIEAQHGSQVTPAESRLEVRTGAPVFSPNGAGPVLMSDSPTSSAPAGAGTMSANTGVQAPSSQASVAAIVSNPGGSPGMTTTSSTTVGTMNPGSTTPSVPSAVALVPGTLLTGPNGNPVGIARTAISSTTADTSTTITGTTTTGTGNPVAPTSAISLVPGTLLQGPNGQPTAIAR
jgi:hypothetical protein